MASLPDICRNCAFANNHAAHSHLEELGEWRHVAFAGARAHCGPIRLWRCPNCSSRCGVE